MVTEVFEVWSGDDHAGDMRLVSLPGRAQQIVEFEYRESWLSSGFALSPELPLDRIVRRPTLGRELFGAFADAAPDRWGQQMLQERARREGIRAGQPTAAQRLLKVPDRTRQGALRFRGKDGFLDPDFGAAGATLV